MFAGLKKRSKFQLSPAWRAFIFDCIAYLFVLLFLYTAINKLWKIDSFERVLHVMPLIGSAANFIAAFVPAAEILIGVMLLVPLSKRAGMLAAFILMLIFTLYLVFMVIYAKDLPCNCGGVLSNLSWQQHIIFNIIFISLAFLALRISKI